MMFKQKIQKIYLFKGVLRRLKKLFVIYKIKSKDIYIEISNEDISNTIFPVFKGYCIFEKEKNLKVQLYFGTKVFDFDIVETKENDKRYKDYQIVHFQKLINPIEVPSNKKAEIVFYINDVKVGKHITEWFLNEEEKSSFKTNKANKISKVKDILACPECRSKKLSNGGLKIICNNCKEEYLSGDISINFLNEDFVKKAEADKTDNISANPYDEKSLGIIEKYKDGLILDNGAGLRDIYYSNVVNFEIADYPTTDVMGIGEVLPFKDEVFDAAFSLNVLEHIKNPFKYAEELKRVIKKGGELYIAAPFLQPYHGYPYHFYNMTSQGLRNLFEDMKILKSGVVEMGQPIYSLSWILNEYSKGLKGIEKRRFSNMKVKDLIKEPKIQLSKGYVTSLSESAKDTISSVNFVICEKI